MRNTRRVRGKAAAYVAPVLVLVVGIAMTIVVTLVIWHETQALFDARMAAQTGNVMLAVADRFEKYVDSVLGVRGLFSASREVTPDEFAVYVAELDLGRRYPGIEAVGWAPAATGQAAGHSTIETRPALPIRMLAMTGEGPASARGFDLFSEPARRAAIERARDSGVVSLTRKVDVAVDGAGEPAPGFLLFAPVYGDLPPEPSLTERRARFRGVVLMKFRSEDFFNALFRGSRGIAFRIYGNTEPSSEALLYDSRWSEGRPRPLAPRAKVDTLPVGGQVWAFEFAVPMFSADAPTVLPFLTALSGLLVSVLLFMIVARQSGARVEAERLLADLSRSESEVALLARAGMRLAGSLDVRTTLQAAVTESVPALGDGCAVVAIGDGDGPDLLETSHADERKSRALGQALERYLAHGDSAPIPWAIDRRFGSSDAHELRERLGAGDPGAFSELGILAALYCPMQRRGRIVGWMLFLRTESNAEYDDRDTRLAAELTYRVTMALDNATLYRRAREAVAARDEFLSIGSHELKTPVTSIQLQVQLLLSSLSGVGNVSLSPDRFSRALESIDRQVRRLVKLINQLLDISRLTSGRLVLERERFDLSTLVREVAARFGEEGAAPVLELTGEVWGLWDRMRIEQVLVNLIGNAIKYGKGKPVVVALAADGQRVRVSVCDQGIGISPEALSRIFDRFERAVSARNFAGLGMGLYIVRSIVEAHGGQIHVVSKVDHGSTFVVDMPLDPTEKQGNFEF